MNPVFGAVAGAATAVVGVATAFLGAVESNGGGVAPWVSYGGSSVAVGGLVFVLKKLLDGSLVPQPIAKLIQESNERDQHAAAVAQELLDVVREGHGREDRIWERLGPGR